ncbi:MAG: choice-of-anchor B family protein [Bacteroidota bacterium]
MRALSLAVLLATALAAPAFAQVPCEDGIADGYPCDRVDLLAHLDFEALGVPDARRGNDIWGWTDPATGTEYALAGTWDGVSFVDLSDPTAPRLVGVLPSAQPPSNTGNNWRDIKTRGVFAFVVSEANGHGMQVFDLRRLRDVTGAPVTFTPDARYTQAGDVHNVVADESLDVVALVGFTSSSSDCGGGGLHLVDISTPTQPTFAGCYDDDGYTHDAQCLVYDGPDTDYTGRAICLSSNESFLSISDITDPANVVGISAGIYATPAYTHQGWLTEDKRFFIINDELDERNGIVPTTRTIVMNVEDLDDPFFVGAYLSDVTTIDHNLYVRGDFIYQANYESGLRVFRFNPEDPTNFEPIGFFDTYPEDDRTSSFNGAWSTYPFFESNIVIIGDRERGLFVVRPDLTGVTAEDEVPETVALSAAYPNPFRRATQLDLDLPRPEPVRAVAYDLLGRQVASLYDGLAEAGRLSLSLDGARLAAGVYVIQIQSPSFSLTRRVTLAR